jgi:phosphoadenosine phosphosulfate reductase
MKQLTKSNRNFVVLPCSEGKRMNHVIFADSRLGMLTASLLTNWTHEIEIHQKGRVVCIPDKLTLQDLTQVTKISEALRGEIVRFNEKMWKKHKVKQAMEIIKHASKMFRRKLAVAFSGGKDSLVVLHMTLKVDTEVPVVYNNTTVEFPETINYVKMLSKKWGFKLVVAKPEVPFFKELKKRGWATHENRWCCSFCKEEPTKKVLSRLNVLAEITGTVRTESIYRRSLTPLRPPTKNPFVIRVNPIYDWNEWEVWNYIKQNDLPVNPLYNLGYKRIGCWCCPINGLSHYLRLKRTHPQLFNYLRKVRPEHPACKTLC